jgi:hypothetical protein
MSVHRIPPQFRLVIYWICRVIARIPSFMRGFQSVRRRGVADPAGLRGIVILTGLWPGRRDGQARRHEDAGAGGVQDAEPPPGKGHRPGPKGGHKLTGQVVDLLEDLLEADPGLRPADLAVAVRERFGVSVHPRSVERALQRRRTARREDEQSGEAGAAPKS